MNVRTRLRGAFALYIAVLVALSLYHVHTTRRAAASARAVADIASRLRAISAMQTARLTQAIEEARKFEVTLEPGYLDKAAETMTAYDAELRHLDSLPLTQRERDLVAPVQARWRSAQDAFDTFRRATRANITPAESTLVVALDGTMSATQSLASASQDAMRVELEQSQRSEQSAERATGLAAAGAVILSVLLSAWLARSILSPLALLQTGTHEVSAGRFGYRLTPSGNDELAQVAHDFNSMTERLDELDRMKRDFVSKVSHDLKTPLSSMQETTGALLDGIAGPITPKQRQLLAINHESGRRLSAMLAKLLDLSRIEAGVVQEKQELVDVRQIARTSVDRLREVNEDGAGGRVVFSADEPASRARVRGDSDHLGQVIDNLVDNALKFSPADTSVTVHVADLDAQNAVLITVADLGPGVPDQDKQQIFTRFYQTDVGRAVRSRGVGLGLTICQEIVAAHGGTIWVSDNEPHGSIFNIALPVALRVETPAAEPAGVAGRERPT